LLDRDAFFTEKCISAARRIGAALIRTPDLFAPAKYLRENALDLEYAAKCREAILSTKGSIVVFPLPPQEGGVSVVAERAANLQDK
jgi:hypothetical protein